MDGPNPRRLQNQNRGPQAPQAPPPDQKDTLPTFLTKGSIKTFYEMPNNAKCKNECYILQVTNIKVFEPQEAGNAVDQKKVDSKIRAK